MKHGPTEWDGVHPLSWYRLIRDAEEYRDRTGPGSGLRLDSDQPAELPGGTGGDGPHSGPSATEPEHERRGMSSTYAPPEPIADPLGFWLADYCPHCVSAVAWRPDALRDAESVIWSGGKTFTTAHCCERCGCEWTERWPVAFLFGIENWP